MRIRAAFVVVLLSLGTAACHRRAELAPFVVPAPIAESREMAISLRLTAAEACEGDDVRAVPEGVPRDAALAWFVDGKAAGEGSEFGFQTGGRPGSHVLTVAVTAPGYNRSEARATVTVRAYQPPVGVISAEPTEINFGQTSRLRADFRNECGGPVRVTFLASEGSIHGDSFDSRAVRFDSARGGDQSKMITITARAEDGRGGTGVAVMPMLVRFRETAGIALDLQPAPLPILPPLKAKHARKRGGKTAPVFDKGARERPVLIDGQAANPDAEIASLMAPGRIAYDVPRSMDVGREYWVTAALVKQVSSAVEAATKADTQLKTLIPNSAAGVAVAVTRTMKLTLTGSDDFAITAHNDKDEQEVDSLSPTEWKWTVMPKNWGKHKRLHLSAVAILGAGKDRKEWTVYEQEFDVRLTPGYVVSHYGELGFTHWKEISAFLTGTGLLSWLAARFKKRAPA